MFLNVKRILLTPNAELPFSFTMDLSDVELYGEYPAVEPVSVTGKVQNRAEVLSVEFTLSTLLHTTCDRCGKALLKPVEQSFSSLLATSLENGENDEIILLENDGFDVEDLARTVFILGMDTKTLCSEDCKGLCGRCGANLNHGSCGCQKAVDPRLAVLAKLLNQE